MEKRSCERYDLQLPVDIRWKDPFGEKNKKSSTCRNISSSGMYICLNNLIKEGTDVDLWIDLPIAVEEVKKSRILARGTVVRNVKEREMVFGHGIRFINYRFSRVKQ